MTRRVITDVRRNARVMDVGGDVPPPGSGFVGLLDAVFAEAGVSALGAWSLQSLLRADYSGSPLFRVRRASDNGEQDIGADASGEADVDALETFCAGTDGFVVTVYDQSGNTRNLSQSTTGRQPMIVDDGAAITQNGRLAALWDGSDDRLVRADACGLTGNPAITILGTQRLGTTGLDKFYQSIGQATSGAMVAPMALGGGNTRSVSFVGENVAFSNTVPPNVTPTTLHTHTVIRAAGARQDGTAYRVNGNALAFTSATPAGTEDDLPNLVNTATSWGDGVNSGAGACPMHASDLIIWNAALSGAALTAAESYSVDWVT